MARFKKENKELMTYILFESSDEELYIESVKMEIDQQFGEVNRKNYYFIKKGLRRILSNTRKYIRYSPHKKTEVDLLIYYCQKLKIFSPSIRKNKALISLYDRLLETISEKVSLLHEDLRYDYEPELEALKD
jgi:hypothetical protein